MDQITIHPMTYVILYTTDNQDRERKPVWCAQPCLYSVWEKKTYQMDLLSSEKHQVCAETSECNYLLHVADN